MIPAPVLWDYQPAPAPQLITPSVFAPGEGAYAPSLELFAESVESYKAQPVEQTDANILQVFGGDFLDRFHYQYITINLGNLLGVQERTLWVWNAFRKFRTLEALAFSSFDGIAFSGETPPTIYGPLTQKTYTISVSLEGPSVIDATVTFDWDKGQTQDIKIEGVRVVTWSWQPDWARSLTDRLEWKTDILQSFRGQEQRRAVRRSPRRFSEFYTGGNETERRVMEAALWGWGGRSWALPLWWDGCDTTDNLSPGASRIYLPASTRDFQVGKPALLYVDWNTYEAFEVSAVSSDHIDSTRPILGSWPAGSRVYPARSARVDGNVTLERFDGAAAFQRMRFAFDEPAEYAADIGTASHNGYPVLEIRPNWTAPPSLEYQRKLAIVDALVGGRSIEDEARIPFTTQRMRFTFTSRAEIDAWRKALYALRGKQVAFYVPTWSRDMTINAIVFPNATSLDIDQISYSALVKRDPGRRNIRIKTTGGAVFYRKITAAADLNQTTERLTIDQALGVQLAPSDIESVMFMSLARLDSDSIDFAWWSGDVAECSIAVRTFNHDV